MVGRQLQNRLLGTAILTLIGVIVFPYIFDGKKEHYLEGATIIPLKPYEKMRFDVFLQCGLLRLHVSSILFRLTH